MASRRNRVSLSQFRLPRDTILFFGGLAGVWHETVVEPRIRIEALVFFGAMMGVVVPLRQDERKRSERESEA